MAGLTNKTPLPHWQWLMEQAGWQNATDMAKATKFPRMTCHVYIYDGRVPTLDRAAVIARAAGVDLNEFAKRLLKQTA